MKVLGISESPRPNQNMARMVKAILAGSSADTEFISLAGMHIEPCTSCLGCKDTNKCVIVDDHSAIRDQLLKADALVIGAPNYHSMLNGRAHCFLERFYQFRHQEKKSSSWQAGYGCRHGGPSGRSGYSANLGLF